MSRAVDTGKEVLRKEAQAILEFADRMNARFEQCVEAIFGCTGRVVLMGIGKSGLICRKIASTLSSVGTPAIFLHPVDCLHGDLGMLQKNDLVMFLSNSGETEEIIKLLPWIKRMGIVTLVLTGNTGSTIAGYGDVVLDVKVDEACPFNIVPTSSTTVALAVGDAMAVALMEKRNFRIEDFANLHPGGSLGRKLLLTVEDLMHTGEALPKVYTDSPMKDVIMEITSKRVGFTGVYDREEHLAGVITDGDLRRAIERHDSILARKAVEVMTMSPKWIHKDALATRALKEMEEFAITSLFVLDKEGDKDPVGIIHIHDLLKAKVV